MTGFPQDVRALIQERAQGMCEFCGLGRGTEIHHRRPRGMGGTKRASTNRASAGLLLCSLCHAMAESRRIEAIGQGLLVAQSQEPKDVPVVYRGRFVYLDDAGGWMVA